MPQAVEIKVGQRLALLADHLEQPRDGDSSTILEDSTIEVTHKIKGAKDGPVVGSTEVTSQTEYEVNIEYLDTRSRSSKVIVVVTSVEVY